MENYIIFSNKQNPELIQFRKCVWSRVWFVAVNKIICIRTSKLLYHMNSSRMKHFNLKFRRNRAVQNLILGLCLIHVSLEIIIPFDLIESFHIIKLRTRLQPFFCTHFTLNYFTNYLL